MSKRIMQVYCVGMRLVLFLSILLLVANPNIALAKDSSSGYQLTIITEPAHAKVTILNTSTEYVPGVSLPSGRYNILVTAPGYQEEKGYIEIQDKEWVGRVVLQRSTEQNNPDLTVIDLEWQRINVEKVALQKAQSQLVAERLVFDQQKAEIENQKKKLIMQQIELAQAQYEVDAQRLEISEKLNRLERLEKSSSRNSDLQQSDKLNIQDTQSTIKPIKESSKLLVANIKELEESKSRIVKDVVNIVELNKKTKKEAEKLKKNSEQATAKKQKNTIVKPEYIVTPNKPKKVVPRSVITEKQFIDLVKNSNERAPSAKVLQTTESPKQVNKGSKLQKLVEEAMAELRVYQPKKKSKKKNRELKNKVYRLKELAPNNSDVKKVLRLYKKRYIVVVGLFTKKNRAKSLVKKLKKQGVSAYYERTNVKNNQLYRVASGLFEKRDQGLAVQKMLLKKMKIKGTILRVFKN
ncbi:MAG: SPOR domain-containing protein [Magnetococcales bacterium]|nr:SPOR domain-containing protein [Magnetococcales bacterium]